MENNPAEEINKRFRKTLEFYLRKISYQIPKSPEIISVGCGYCSEQKVLSELFKGRFLGIDIDQECISHLKTVYEDDRLKVLCGDARELSLLVEQKADVIITRHPNIHQDDWKEIYKECHKITKPEGILITTFYLESEMGLAERYIKNAGYKVRACEENKVIRNKDSFLKSDEFVIVSTNWDYRSKSFFKRIFWR